MNLLRLSFFLVFSFSSLASFRTALAENLCQGLKPLALTQLKNKPSEFPEHLTQSIEFDLNSDGKNEYLESAGCGNGFCNFVFYQMDPKLNGLYRCIGGLDIHPLAFEVLRSKHHGWSDLLAYFHGSATEGRIARLEFNGNNYVETAGFDGKSAIGELLRPSYIEP